MNETIYDDFSRFIVTDLVLDSISFVLATVCNSCLLGLELRNWVIKKRISQPRFLIMTLALIDLLSSILSTLPKLLLFNEIDCTHALNFSVYMMSRFFVMCSLNLSKLTVALMAVERFISVRAPFFYVRACTVTTFCMVECVLVLFTIIKAAIYAFGDTLLFEKFLIIVPSMSEEICGYMMLVFEYDHSWRRSYEMQTTDYVDIFQIVLDFIVILVILLCNIGVIIGLKAMEKRVRESCPRPRDEPAHETDLMTITGKEFSRLMLAIIVVVIVLTTPNMVWSLLKQLGVYRSFYVDYVCRHLAMCIIFANPFLYGLLRRKIRRQLAFQLRRTCNCFRGNSVTASDVTRSDTNVNEQLNMRRLAARAERAIQARSVTCTNKPP